jgi:nicotinamide-nucleotide amidase
MLEKEVLPRLVRAFPPRPRAEAHLHFVGEAESVVDQKIRPIMAMEKDAQFTILAHLGFVDFDIFVSGTSRSEVRRRLERLVRKILKTMGAAFYGRDADYPLERVIAQAFQSRKATLAVAESCTGGMLSKQLTDIPGSSGYFLGGVVSYSNAVKSAVLKVPPALIKKWGAVSRPVALAMAKGVRAGAGSTWGLGITGIAGPSGATSAKPLGLVYIGLSGPGHERTLECRFRGSRDAIRQRAVIAALNLLRQIYL